MACISASPEAYSSPLYLAKPAHLYRDDYPVDQVVSPEARRAGRSVLTSLHGSASKTQICPIRPSSSLVDPHSLECRRPEPRITGGVAAPGGAGVSRSPNDNDDESLEPRS